MAIMGIGSHIHGIDKAIEDNVLVRIEMRNDDDFDFAEVVICANDAGNEVVFFQTYDRLADDSLKPNGDWRELDGSGIRHVILRVDRPVPKSA